MSRYDRKCSACDRALHARGLCNMHYQQWQNDPERFHAPRLRQPSTEEAFWARVEVGDADECWHWTGPIKDGGGYGNATLPGRPGTFGAHVVAWYWTHGEVPPAGMHLDHVCHNADPDCPGGVCHHRACVNPKHLVVATPLENLMNGKSVPRVLGQRKACDKGHPFSGANLVIRSDGARRCRQCHNIRMREWNRVRRLRKAAS